MALEKESGCLMSLTMFPASLNCAQKKVRKFQQFVWFFLTSKAQIYEIHFPAVQYLSSKCKVEIEIGNFGQFIEPTCCLNSIYKGIMPTE